MPHDHAAPKSLDELDRRMRALVREHGHILDLTELHRLLRQTASQSAGVRENPAHMANRSSLVTSPANRLRGQRLRAGIARSRCVWQVDLGACARWACPAHR
jgi:hypothetical protein